MKWKLRLAVAFITVAGSAQSQVTCQASGGTLPIVRGEGLTELIGDLLLTCTGGNPTPSGQPVPLVDVTIVLNTSITGRLLGGGYMDALLTIDEPYPSVMSFYSLAPVTRPANSPAQALCYSSASTAPGSCNYLLGNGGGGYRTAASPYLQPNAFTIYAAQQVTANKITWFGVPIDPPGPSADRVIRLTNLRANAAQLSAPIPITQVFAALSVSSSQFVVTSAQQTLADINWSNLNSNGYITLCTCPSHNASLLGGTGTPAFDGNAGYFTNSSIQRRNFAVTADGPTPPAVLPQNVPGYSYFTETGFLPSPVSVSSSNYTLKPADSGARILLVFYNVPVGVHVFLPLNTALAEGSSIPLQPGIASGEMQLIQAQPNGFSGTAYTSLTATATVGSTPVAEASRIGTNVFATYEIVNAVPSNYESASIPVALAFDGSTSYVGNITVTATLAPLSSTGVAAGDLEPIPRFTSIASLSTPAIVPLPIGGDFDSNGVPDRVWQNDTNSQVTVHYSDYAGKPSESLNYLNTQKVPGWHVVAVADFNGDGIPDLVWQDDVTRKVTVYYYGGAGGAVLQGWNWLVSSPVPGWRVVAAADFNGDGVPDLVWQNDTTRQVTVYYYGGVNGAVFQNWKWLDSNGAPGWHVVGAGDFNRDGVPDLVWQNDTTRQVTIYYMGGPTGAVIQNWKWLDAQGVPGWTVKAVSDVNGDGIPDLLWQNDTTHQVTVYFYGGPAGASFQTWSWIAQTGVPGWSIVN